MIRKAEHTDVKTIYDFVLQLDCEDAEIRDPEMTIEDIKAAGFGNDPLFEAFIAEDQKGIPLGAISFFRGYSGWHAKPVALIHMLYVTKEARRQNVAKKLMAKVASLVIERGWVRLELFVEEGRPAIQFYESIGMHNCEERHYKFEKEDLVQLIKLNSD